MKQPSNLPDMYREFLRKAIDDPNVAVLDIPTYATWEKQRALDTVTRLFVAFKLQSSDLDELVHDLKSGEAAAINNSGLEDQLTYLLTHYSPDELAYELKQLANAKQQAS